MNSDEKFLLACIKNDEVAVKDIDTSFINTDTLLDGFSIVLKNRNKDLMLYFLKRSKDSLRFCLIAWEVMTNSELFAKIIEKNSDVCVSSSSTGLPSTDN